MTVQYVVVVRPVRHGLHFLLTLLTAGAWGIVWLIAGLRHRAKVRR